MLGSAAEIITCRELYSFEIAVTKPFVEIAATSAPRAVMIMQRLMFADVRILGAGILRRVELDTW